MGFLDVSSPMKWGIVKIISVLLCILIIVGVFFPWFWVEAKVQISGYEKIDHYDSVGINDYPASYPIIFSALFSLLFIFLSYDININVPNKPRRINELFSGIFAFLIFMYCVSLAYKVNEEISKYTSRYPTSASESITLLGKTYSGSASINGGVGAGFVLIAASSFLLMIFSFLLWRQKSQAQAPVTVAPIQAPVPPAPVSEEKAIAAFAKIPGITIKKATSLYDAGFKSFSDLSAATSNKLLTVKGITLNDVKNIKEAVRL